MTIDISDNDPRIEYTVAQGATQTVFTVPFEFFEDSDVRIYVDGTLKSLGSNYTLSGGDGSTGTATFVQPVTGATGGSTVSVVRHVSLERTTDFPAGQEINRAVLNEQLDTITAQIADLDNKVDRTIHLNDYEVAPSTLLTEDRKGKTLAFNLTTGAVEAGPLSSDIAIIADNIAEILAADDEAAAAAASAAAAAVSETNAGSSETAASGSATASATSATNSATSASGAASSASAASTSETNAATSETNAATSETNAAISETAAASSETAAATSESNASTSETNAATSATSSASSATASAASATAAAASETNADADRVAAQAAAATATTKASEASTSETNAATSASTATTKASEAATSATNSATSAAESETAKTAAEAAKDAALAALDNFDDRYLGAKASDPTLDNDGDPLVAGALYYNTTDDVMKVYEGSVWVAAYASLSGALLQANNLSDLVSVAAARTNLGLGTAATTASTDYATAAQGALADTATQPADLATVATTGGYSDLTGLPTLGTAAATASTDYATAAQGALADSATQPADLGTAAATNSTDYATAAQGTLANSAVQPNDSPSFGSVTVSGTVDGRDVAADGTKLDGIASGATNVTNNNQLTNGAGYTTYTANQALNTNSSPTFGTVTATSYYGNGSNLTGVSAGVTVISTTVISSSVSSVAFTGFSPSDYTAYQVELINVIPVQTYNTTPTFRLSTNGGSSYDSASTNYTMAGVNRTYLDVGSGVGGEYITAGMSGFLYIHGPHSQQKTISTWDFGIWTTGNTMSQSNYRAGAHNSFNDVNGIQFRFNGSLIESGTFVFRGIK